MIRWFSHLKFIFMKGLNMCKISLVNQSCFDYLKTLKNESVSLVLTDPPYECQEIRTLHQVK